MVKSLVDKLKAMPRFVKEIISAIVLCAVSYLSWVFAVQGYIGLSDQGLLTIATALSATMGVLTAIVISFLFIIWQSSHQGRDTAYWHWRDSLERLCDLFDTKLEVLWDIREEVSNFTHNAKAVSIVTPMSSKDIIEIKDKLLDKISAILNSMQGIAQPTEEDLIRGRAYNDVGTYLTDLITANFSHRLSHERYRMILDLKLLAYRLLALLAASLMLVGVTASTSSTGIPDTFNPPAAIILIGWCMYLFIWLGYEMRKATALEERFPGLEKEDSLRRMYHRMYHR